MNEGVEKGELSASCLFVDAKGGKDTLRRIKKGGRCGEGERKCGGKLSLGRKRDKKKVREKVALS